MRKISVRKAAGTVVTNTTNETVLDSYTIKANTLQAGKCIRVQFCASCPSTNSTDTLLVKVRVGPTTLTGTAVVTTTAVDVANGHVVSGYIDLVSRGLGASAQTVVAQAQVSDPGASGAAGKHYSANVGSLNTMGDLLVEVTATWSVANAGNQVQMEAFTVYEM
jgi:hypothetical protein